MSREEIVFPNALVRLLLILAIGCGSVTAIAQLPDVDSSTDGQRNVDVSVGMAGYIRQVVLPGTELKVKDVDPRRTAVAVSVDRVYPHGEQLRYDLTFIGLEPGVHDLADYLVRKDGSSTASLPRLRINVNSVLPVERLAPSTPQRGFVAAVGGYYTVMLFAVVVWVIGLLAILFWKSKAPEASAVNGPGQSLTEAEVIQQLVTHAIDNEELSADQKADLDLKILNFWRTRRNLQGATATDALVQLKTDEQAGPLLAGLEQWFYSRTAPSRDQIVAMLKPMAQVCESENVGGVS